MKRISLFVLICIAFLSPLLKAEAAITDSLISHWKLDEASSTRADSVTTNNLSQTGTVTSTTGKLGNAAVSDGTSGTNYLSKTNNVSLATGNIDYSIAAWVYISSKAGTGLKGLVTKWGSSGAREYALIYDPVTDRFNFYVSPAGSTSTLIQANNLGAPALNTWYFIVAWHDSVADTVNIQVNNGSIDSAAHSTGTFVTGSPVQVLTYLSGVTGGNSTVLNGRMDSVSFWKKVLTPTERSLLYNSGNGLEYPFSTAVPDAPTSLNATPGNTQVSLTWTAPADNGSTISDYVVEYKLSSDGSWSTFADGTSTTAAATVTGLTNGSPYDFRVSATNAIGTGTVSSTATTTPRTVPGAPTSLNATPGNTQVSLTWTAPASNGGSALTDYLVEYKLSSDGSWSTFADGTSTTAAATVTGLTNGSPYDFRVSATNAAGTGTASSTATTTPRTVPGAPTSLNAVAGDSQVSLTWVAPASNGGSALTDYLVEYKLTSDGGWSTFSDGTSTTAAATVTSLTNGLSYDFRVSAINAAGTGSASSTATATPNITAAAPGAPTSLNATAGNTQVGLTWTAPVSDGGSALTDYLVEYKLAADSSWTTFSDGTSTTAAATVTGLTNGSSYNFRVSAINAIGTSSPSGTATATPVTVPGAPTSLNATPGNTQVSLTWSAPVSNGGSALTDYVVEYKLSADSTWDVFADGTSTTAAATVTSLTNGSAYDFRVSATNAIGTGSVSSTASATPRTVPGAPTSLNATPGAAQVGLTWTAPASNGGSAITDYVVEYKLAADSTWNIFTDGTSATAAATVTSLTNGSSYNFRVSATNAAGTGVVSGTATATPVTVPGAPTSLGGTPGDTQVALTWTAPASNGGSALTDYLVEYKLSTDGSWSTFADGTSTTAAATVTGLTNGLAYNFRVSAINAIGTGTPSSTATATPTSSATAPDAPTSLNATPANTQVGLTWSAPGSNGGSALTDYLVEYKLSADSSWTTFSDGVSTSTAATVTGLTNGSPYDFRISAINAIGTSSPSGTATATPVTVPGAPTSLNATPGNTQVSLTWSAPVSNGGSALTDYVVEYKLAVDSSWTTFTDGVSTTAAATVTGLTNGSSYNFRVHATNAVGTGAASSTATTTPRTVPDAPDNFIATGLDTQVSLSWDDPLSDGGSAVTDYVIEYKLTSDGSWLTFSDGVSTDTSTSVTSLANGSSYDFRVSAINAAGTGSASSTATATPIGVPFAPTSLSGTPGDTQVALTWAAASNGGSAITDYIVEYKLSSDSSWSTFTDGTSATATATVTGLTNDLSYDFRVYAENGEGISSASTIATATPTAVVISVAPTPGFMGGRPLPSFFVPATTITNPTVETKPSTSTYIFKGYWKRGARNNEVKNIQIYLNKALGLKLDTDGIFGKGTEAALAKLQKLKGIKPAAGVFGAITRAYFNSHPL